MQAMSAAGHSNFLHAGSKSDRLAGKKIAAQVLPDLQGEGPCGKEAFLLSSTFGYFWCFKSNSLRGN
jgi:hypothetical protein